MIVQNSTHTSVQQATRFCPGAEGLNRGGERTEAASSDTQRDSTRPEVNQGCLEIKV